MSMIYTNYCKPCQNLVISTAVAYDATANALNITIPNSGFKNCDKVCLLVAQEIPETTTLTALVNILIEDSTYPLVKCNCLQATACNIKQGVIYPTKVITNGLTGTFKLLIDPKCLNQNSRQILPVEVGGGA